MSKTGNKSLFCNFCGKDYKDVRKLIAGPTSYICDECVILSMEIIAGEEAKRGTSYGKFLAFHKRKKPTNSLESFNNFFNKEACNV